MSSTSCKTVRDAESGQVRFHRSGKTGHHEMIIRQLESSGVLEHQFRSVSVRIDKGFIDAATIATGAKGINEALEISLAELVIDDCFHEAFAKPRGGAPQDLDLEF